MTATTCDDCSAIVGEDSCRTHRERETFRGAPGSYTVIDAYVCTGCGYRREA